MLKKNKELIVNFTKLNDDDIPKIKIDGTDIERVNSSKLLGVTFDKDLKWKSHVTTIYKKAARRLYIIVMSKRSGLNQEDLFHIYCTAIRPLLEYACQLWHTSLTQEQHDLIETIQSRVFKIILPSLSYNEAFQHLATVTLYDRREELCSRLFKQIKSNKEHRLYHLFQVRQGRALRKNKQFELEPCRTERYKNSYIPYCTYKFQ